MSTVSLTQTPKYQWPISVNITVSTNMVNTHHWQDIQYSYCHHPYHHQCPQYLHSQSSQHGCQCQPSPPLTLLRSNPAIKHYIMMCMCQQWISLMQPSRNTWVCLMWPFTYMIWNFTYIPLTSDLEPSFPLLCNEGIVIFHSYNCNYLWFPLLCNKDNFVLSDLPDLV